MQSRLNTLFLFSLIFISPIFSIYLKNSNTAADKARVQTNPRFILFGAYIQNNDESETRQYFNAENIMCSVKNTCLPQYGVCVSPAQCKCKTGFANFVSGDDKVLPNITGNYCSYRQKRQLISFLLESFLSFGIGHIYAERYVQGYIKLILCFSILVIFLVQHFLSKDMLFEDYLKSSPVLLLIFIALTFVWTMWQLVDMVLIGLNKYFDGNNMPLEAW